MWLSVYWVGEFSSQIIRQWEVRSHFEPTSKRLWSSYILQGTSFENQRGQIQEASTEIHESWTCSNFPYFTTGWSYQWSCTAKCVAELLAIWEFKKHRQSNSSSLTKFIGDGKPVQGFSHTDGFSWMGYPSNKPENPQRNIYRRTEFHSMIELKSSSRHGKWTKVSVQSLYILPAHLSRDRQIKAKKFVKGLI